MCYIEGTYTSRWKPSPSWFGWLSLVIKGTTHVILSVAENLHHRERSYDDDGVLAGDQIF